jgi:hypothetical protein
MAKADQQDTSTAGSALPGAAASAPETDVQTPASGGSYQVDPDTGALTLVERTKQRNEE